MFRALAGEFRSFLTRSNALALAIGVIIGAATQRVVTAIVGDVLMPLIGLVLPRGDWRDAKIVFSRDVAIREGKEVVSENAIRYGDLIGATIDFVFIALIVFLIARALAKGAFPATKECPACKERVPLAATRCRACTGELPS